MKKSSICIKSEKDFSFFFDAKRFDKFNLTNMKTSQMNKNKKSSNLKENNEREITHLFRGLLQRSVGEGTKRRGKDGTRKDWRRLGYLTARE